MNTESAKTRRDFGKQLPLQFLNDNNPRSASVGRPMVNGTPQCIVSTSGVEDVVLRRPTTNGHSLTSTPARRPKTTTTEVQQSFGLPSANGVSPMQPSPNQRHSTCTLHLNDTVSSNLEDRTLKNKTNGHSQEEENEEEDGEETVSGTLDDETSDDGMLPDDRVLKNIDGGAKRISISGETQRPDLNCVLSREHKYPSRIHLSQKMMSVETYTPPLQVIQINPASLREFLPEHASGVFVALGSHFKNSSIRRQINKFHVIIETISPPLIVQFANIVQKPSPNPYDNLNAAILQHTQPFAVQ
ncbi:hypothetical protein ACTXT7_014990 [Hymenolepis weldensis]